MRSLDLILLLKRAVYSTHPSLHSQKCKMLVSFLRPHSAAALARDSSKFAGAWRGVYIPIIGETPH